MGTSLDLSLVLEHLPSVTEGLGSALVPTQKEKKKNHEHSLLLNRLKTSAFSPDSTGAWD